jgi:hypothetical protein
LMSGSFSFSKSRVSCENDNQCCRVYFFCKLNKMIAFCLLSEWMLIKRFTN